LPANGVSWDDNGLTVHGTKTLRRKDQEGQNWGMTSSGQLEHPSPITSSIPGQAKCNQPSTTDGTTVLLLTPDIRKAIPGSQLPGLPITSQTVPSGSGRSAMVRISPHLLEWEKPYFASFNNSNRLRRFTVGLGSYLWGEIDKRSLVPQEQTIHINFLELLAATLAVQTFAQEKLSISILLRIDNMTTVYSIHKQEREDSVSNSFTYVPMVVVHGEKHLIGSPAPTRSHELHCKQRIQSLVQQVRVESLTKHISENQPPARSPINRPICKSPAPQITICKAGDTVGIIKTIKISWLLQPWPEIYEILTRWHEIQT